VWKVESVTFSVACLGLKRDKNLSETSLTFVAVSRNSSN